MNIVEQVHVGFLENALFSNICIIFEEFVLFKENYESMTYSQSGTSTDC